LIENASLPLPSTEAEFDTEALAIAIVEAAWEHKARNVRVLDVRGIVSYADYLVVAHGTGERHAHAIAGAVIDDLRPAKVRPLGVEGTGAGGWILVDFADVVLHVFSNASQRRDFNIESIYSDAPRLVLADVPAELEEGEDEDRTPHERDL